MSEQIEMITASDLKPLLDDLNEMRTIAETLKTAQPVFPGRRYMSNSMLCRKLNICKLTLATYRANGVLGYYNLSGKILYSDTDIEAFLQRHYLPPFR